MGNTGSNGDDLDQLGGSGGGKELTDFLRYFSGRSNYVDSWVSGGVEETVWILIVLRSSVLQESRKNGMGTRKDMYNLGTLFF